MSRKGRLISVRLSATNAVCSVPLLSHRADLNSNPTEFSNPAGESQ